MKSGIISFLFLVSVNIASRAQTNPVLPQLKSAGSHPMMYYLALPNGWTSEKKWPVLVVLESADKQFKKNAERFADARKELPFIIIAPINVNNGFDGRKDPALWPYSNKIWNYIDSVTDCKFNQDGILSIAGEVARKYNGEEKFFITGFEAGTHALWPLVFEHPEKLKAAIPVEGNYNRNTCIAKQVYSNAPDKKDLPIIGIYGEKDAYYGAGGMVFNQWQAAKKMAIDHGFSKVSEKMITGKGHEPMPAEVFEILVSLRKN